MTAAADDEYSSFFFFTLKFNNWIQTTACNFNKWSSPLLQISLSRQIIKAHASGYQKHESEQSWSIHQESLNDLLLGRPPRLFRIVIMFFWIYYQGTYWKNCSTCIIINSAHKIIPEASLLNTVQSIISANDVIALYGRLLRSFLPHVDRRNFLVFSNKFAYFTSHISQYIIKLRTISQLILNCNSSVIENSCQFVAFLLTAFYLIKILLQDNKIYKYKLLVWLVFDFGLF